MNCSVCGVGPHCGFPVYRNNPMNEDPTIWRCKAHLDIPSAKVYEGITTVTMNYNLKVSGMRPEEFTIKQINDLQIDLKAEQDINKRREILIKFKDMYKLTNGDALTLATWDLPKFKK